MLDYVIKIILTQQIVQLILVAYVGALLGEMQKEIEDDDSVVLSKFLVSWLGSGFGGVMVALAIKGTIARDNEYVVISTAGVAGYLGRKKSLKMLSGFLPRLLEMAASYASKHSNDKEKDNDEEE